MQTNMSKVLVSLAIFGAIEAGTNHDDDQALEQDQVTVLAAHGAKLLSQMLEDSGQG